MTALVIIAIAWPLLSVLFVIGWLWVKPRMQVRGAADMPRWHLSNVQCLHASCAAYPELDGVRTGATDGAATGA